MSDMNGGFPGVRAFMLDHFADEEIDYVPTETREEIQSFVKVSQATVSRWIGGKTTVNRKHWTLLAQAAGTTVDVLRGYINRTGAESASKSGDNTVETLRTEVTRLAATVKQLSDDVEALKARSGPPKLPAKR